MRNRAYPQTNIILKSLLAVFVIALMIISAFSPAAANVYAASEAQKSGIVKSAAGTPGLSDPKELEAFLDSVITEELNGQHIAGAAVVIVKDGSLFFSKGYGYADVEAEIPVDTEKTLFRMGSIGKMFTWTAVMQLVEQGRLDLDADVNQYLDFTIPATYPEPVTLKHLMTHTAGFEDTPFGVAATSAELTVPINIWLANNIPARAWPPGEVPSYSNYGTTLAGYIVERVSGMAYADYVEQNILIPLGMMHTTPRQPLPADLQTDLAKGYKYLNGTFQPQGFEYMTIVPAGAASATPADMARFMIAHLQYGRYCEAGCPNGEVRILDEATAKQMQSQLWTADERINGMTYGFMELNQNGHRIVGHLGDTGLFHSMMALLPEQNVGFLFSYNSATYGLGSTLLEAFLDHYYPAAPAESSPVVTTSGNLDRFSGSYPFTRLAHSQGGKIRGILYAFRVKSGGNGELILNVPGSTIPHRLVEVSPLYFREIEGDGYALFHEDASGNIDYMHTNISLPPAIAAQKAPWYEQYSFTLGLLGTCAVLFLLTLVVELVRSVVGWFKRRNAFRPPALARLARAVAAGTAISALGFMVVVFLFLIDSWAIASGQRDLPMIFGAVSLVIVALTLANVILTGMAWRRGWWSIVTRSYHSLVTIASVAFVWFLSNWNQIGWQWW